MPLFEYRCQNCGCDFEEIASASDTVPCPKCASKQTTRLMSAVNHSGSSTSSFSYDSHSDSSSSHGGGCGCSGCSGGHCASCGH